jgi:hypothetical protein
MELQKRMEGLATGFADGLLSYEQMVAGTETLRRGLRALEERLGALTAISGFEEFAGAHSNADTQGRWDNLTLGRKRKVIESLFDRIIVSPPGRGFRGGFKPECVTYVWANDERPPTELTA